MITYFIKQKTASQQIKLDPFFYRQNSSPYQFISRTVQNASSRGLSQPQESVRVKPVIRSLQRAFSALCLCQLSPELSTYPGHGLCQSSCSGNPVRALGPYSGNDVITPCYPSVFKWLMNYDKGPCSLKALKWDAGKSWHSRPEGKGGIQQG